MKKYVLGYVFILIVIALSFFSLQRRSSISPRGSGDMSKLQVVASFYPLFFFAREIGGERAQVYNLTPAGAEPHTYEPTAVERARIEQSALLILNGGGFETWGSAIEQTIEQKQTHIVRAGEGLGAQQEEDKGENNTDPHVWLSPPLAKKMSDAIARGFVSADPAHAADYSARVAALKARLNELDREYRQGLSVCAQKDIITAHDAFGHLASAYHLNEISIAGVSPDAEPSAVHLADIAQFAKKKGIRHIFFERLASPKFSETIAREIGAQTLVLNPLEGLSTQEEAAGKNYFTEMYRNLVNLKIALQCKI